MKEGAMVYEMWVDGKPVEIDGAELSLIDLADLQQGFVECPGCHERYVLIEHKYCADCQRLHSELEDKRVHLDSWAHQRRRGAFRGARPQAVPSNCSVLAILAGVGVVAAFTMTGMWYVGPGLIGYCLGAGWQR
jgi:hypothetical protein